MAVGRINSGIGFNDFNPSAYRRMTGGVGAAGQATVAENFSMLEDNKPDFAGLAEMGQERQGLLTRGAMKAISGVRATGLQAAQAVEQAKEDAEAMKSAARRQASASKTGSLIKAGTTLLGSALMFSDEEMKENVERIEDALTTLRNLRPVTFNYKEEYTTDYNRVHHGFIAQEYGKVLPDATYHDHTVDKLCIDTTDLIGLLVRAVQQLEIKVTHLEAKAVLEAV